VALLEEDLALLVAGVTVVDCWLLLLVVGLIVVVLWSSLLGLSFVALLLLLLEVLCGVTVAFLLEEELLCGLTVALRLLLALSTLLLRLVVDLLSADDRTFVVLSLDTSGRYTLTVLLLTLVDLPERLFELSSLCTVTFLPVVCS
jgi:hypothetical protein